MPAESRSDRAEHEAEAQFEQLVSWHPRHMTPLFLLGSLAVPVLARQAVLSWGLAAG